MNNFNNVFVVVKRYCHNDDNSFLFDSADALAKEARVPVSSLEFYLNSLSDIGLIIYSKEEKRITLTESGKNRVGLFTL